MKYRITIGDAKEPVEMFDNYDKATDRAQEIGRSLQKDVFVRDENGYSVADYDREADMVYVSLSELDLPAPAVPMHKQWGVAMCDPHLGDDLWSLVARHRNRRSAERYARHRNRTCERPGVEYIAVQYITNARYDENGAIVYSMDQDIVLVNGVPATRNERPVRLGFSWLPPARGDYE